MKIEIEIPEWAQDRNILVLAGFEFIGCIPLKKGNSNYLMKTERCGRCGECCKMPYLANLKLPLKENGECEFLTQEDGLFSCGLGSTKPLACVCGEPKAPGCKTNWETYHGGNDHPDTGLGEET